MFGNSGVRRGRRTALAVLLMSSLLGIRAFGAKPELDHQRMQRDLRIMEDVLRHLHEDAGCCGRGPRSPGPAVHGVYLEGYGVVLAVDGECLSGPVQVRLEVTEPEAGAPGESPLVVRRECTGAASCSHPDSVAARTKEVLVEFLSSYAHAIGQLGGKDRITVVLPGGQGGPGVPFPGLPRVIRRIVRSEDASGRQADTLSVGDLVGCDVDSLGHASGQNLGNLRRELHMQGSMGPVTARTLGRGLSGTGPSPEGAHVQGIALCSGGRRQPALVATVSRDDVSAFHRGRISAEELAGRIEFEEGTLESADEKRLDIMVGILEKGLNHGTMAEARGMYVKGLGALFFVDAGPAAFGVQLIAKRFLTQELATQRGGGEHLAPETRSESGAGQPRERLEDLKDQLVELVAEYGSSLRMLEADESAVVVIRPSHAPFGGGRGPVLVLRARYEDISAFDRGQLDLEGFRRKVELTQR